MKTFVTFLLILALLIPSAAALAEEAPLSLGYLTQLEEEEGWYTHCANAFAYAAERQGVEVTILTYTLPEEEIPEEEDSEDRVQPGLAELLALIEAGVDGVVAVPATPEQAVELADAANQAGVPIVFEGMDMTFTFPVEDEEAAPEDTPDPAEARPYVAAVSYGDSAAYALTRWLNDEAYNPLIFHCALAEDDPEIQSGIQRALAAGGYLTIAHEWIAEGDSVQDGVTAVNAMYASFTMFGCVFADSEALAEGCLNAVHSAGDNFLVAAIVTSPEALPMLQAGKFDAAAITPASVEGVQTFKTLFDFVTEGTLPENPTGRVQLDAIVVTKGNTSAWIGDDDYESAYALAFPEIEDAEVTE